MEVIKLRDEFIKLGQALKAANLVEDGVEAKYVIQDGEVLVNGEVDTRRGRKLYDGDVISFHGEEIKIVKQVYTCISNQQNLKITEITTHSKGAMYLLKRDCDVIDIGGQDTKIINISNGMVSDFIRAAFPWILMGLFVAIS